MKFTTTDNWTFRSGIGNVPKPWIEFTFKPHESYDDVYKNSIRKYFYENIKVWDFDMAGSETHDFVFEDGKAFRLEYSWWMEYGNDDEEENGPTDVSTIEEISIDEANVPEKTMGRNWI